MIGATPLDALIRQAELLRGVRRSDLGLGDRVIVRTRNSFYSILSLGNGQYRVSGGWFDRMGVSPVTTTISGCTWGGSAIKTDLVAGQGLFLEFGNRVRTTRIQDVRLAHLEESHQLH